MSQMNNYANSGNVFNNFSSNRYLEGSKEFLQSNSIVAKFAFLLLVLILFIIALRLGTTVLSKVFTPSGDPILINGMIDSKQFMRIAQDPSVSGAIPLLRSNNSEDGLVFTWSVWIYINDLTYKQNEYRHIFNKGNDDVNITKRPYGMVQPNNAPGLYIAPDTNALVIVMNTFEHINEELLIPDIPLNKWINVIIRVDEQHKLDAYVNGNLIRRHIMKSIPRQNYGDVYVSMNGGFSGYTSSLQYFNTALGVNDIQSIVEKGPNLTLIGNSSSGMTDTNADYLSLRWFFSGNHDMYY
jgi:hypothetical protein